MTIVQISWFIDSAPYWLASTILAISLLIIVISQSYWLGKRLERYSTWQTTIGISALTIGLYTGLYVKYTGIFVLLAIFIGKWIEGAAGVRLLSKLYYSISEQSMPPGSMKKRVIRIFFIYLIISIGLLLISGILIQSDYFRIGFQVRSIWTITIIAVTTISFNWKRKILNKSQNRLTTVGLLLLVIGSEIYSFEFLTLNIISSLIGSVGYTLGFWSSIPEIPIQNKSNDSDSKEIII